MWLLCVLLALADQVISNEIVYPDQYEMMMKAMSTTRPNPSYGYAINNGRDAASLSAANPLPNINQAVPNDQQLNREVAAPSIAAAQPHPFYTTTPIPFYSSTRPSGSPDPDWGSHVRIIINMIVFTFCNKQDIIIIFIQHYFAIWQQSNITRRFIIMQNLHKNSLSH